MCIDGFFSILVFWILLNSMKETNYSNYTWIVELTKVRYSFSLCTVQLIIRNVYGKVKEKFTIFTGS